MKNRQWKKSIVSALIVGMICTVMAASASATDCRLDWNGDFQVDESDYLVGDPMGGFYAEWYIYVYYPGYYPVLFPGLDPARLDYDGDADVDQDDLMGPLDAAAATEGYYVEWYIFLFYPGYYTIFFPEFDVCPPLPGQSCPAMDWIDVGGPDAFGEPKFMTALDGKIYFQATTTATGRELHVYDPATGLATLAVDINPGDGSSSPWDLIVHLGKLYFKANGADFDTELYVYDPAAPGTATKIDVNPTSFSGPRNFLNGSNGKLYFEAKTANDGWELHSYDPVSGNIEYWDHWPGLDQYDQPYSTYPKYMVEHNGYIYMSAKGPEGTELHKFSLATEQLTRLSNIATGYDLNGNGKNSYPQYLTIFNDELFFNACDDAAVNCELWILDPTDDSLREIVIEPGLGVVQGGLVPMGGAPRQFTEWGGKLYFSAQQVVVGIELFVYDPVTDDVELEFDSHPGTYDFCYGTCFDGQGVPYACAPCMPYGNDGHTDQLTLVGDKFYYVAPFENREIWEYDLNTGVGQQFMEIFPGLDEWGNPGHGEPRFLMELDGNLYFQASSEDLSVDGASKEFFMITFAPENCP